jgi:CheY-like chemotaxis protein
MHIVYQAHGTSTSTATDAKAHFYAAPLMPAQGQACRVLVVDDDKDSAQTFAYLLAGMGHEARHLTDPAKVLRTVARFKPHIVFLDIAMPGMNGWELAAALRKQYSYDALRLVALTALGEEADRIRSRQAGFDAHILKPVSMDLIESVIDQLFPKA